LVQAFLKKWWVESDFKDNVRMDSIIALKMKDNVRMDSIIAL